MAEVKALKDKLESVEGEGRLQKRLMERASQPHAYIMADVERAERELAAANKRIKGQEDELKKAKKDIESLSIVSQNCAYIFSPSAAFKMIFNTSCRGDLRSTTFRRHYRVSSRIPPQRKSMLMT